MHEDDTLHLTDQVWSACRQYLLSNSTYILRPGRVNPSPRRHLVSGVPGDRRLNYIATPASARLNRGRLIDNRGFFFLFPAQNTVMDLLLQ